jgi:hypothetical protein
MPNVSMERQILLTAQTATASAQLSACCTVIGTIERNVEKKNSRPSRGLVRKMLSQLVRDPLYAEQAKLLLERLAVLSASPRKRKIKPTPPPIVGEAPPTETAPDLQIPAAPIIETPGEPAPIPPPTAEEVNRATTVGGRISWTCMNCRQQSLCRDIGEEKWLCRGCESERKMLEPRGNATIIRHHVTIPAEASRDFARSQATDAQGRQNAEARAAARQQAVEKADRDAAIKNISKLSLAEQKKVLFGL